MIHFKTSFSPETAPLATLVQPTLFDALTFSGLAGNIAYQSTGGVLQGVLQDPCMQLTWTGATFNKTAFVRKYLNYPPGYNDVGWKTRQPTHYRFSCSMSLNGAGFTIGEQIQFLKFFHNSGATGTEYASAWLTKSQNGWRMRLYEGLWSGASSAPVKDFLTSTTATFSPHTSFAFDIISVPGVQNVLIGQPYPSSRLASSVPGTNSATLINNEGYTILSMIGAATMPRIAGFDMGAVTLVTTVSTLITGCAFRFDDIRFEDNFDLNWSPDQNDSILGTFKNEPFAGFSNDCDLGIVNLFPGQFSTFGAPLSNLFTIGVQFNDAAPGSKIPSTTIAVEPNAVYRLSGNAPSGWTGIGSTKIGVADWRIDMTYPTTVEYRNMANSAPVDFIFRTGPHQNSVWISNDQIHLMTYNLTRLR